MAVELAVEVAVEFQSGSRKKSGCRKTPHPKLQELERKLRVTQNITDMSEQQYQMLWNKTMKSYGAAGISQQSNKNSGTTMLQYKRTGSWSASGTPINFDKKINNFGMEPNYTNGVVTITDPGVYLIQSSLRNYSNGDMRQDIIKDHQVAIYGIWSKSWVTSELNHVMYLDFLDTINIRLSSGGPHDKENAFFTVIKMD